VDFYSDLNLKGHPIFSHFVPQGLLDLDFYKRPNWGLVRVPHQGLGLEERPVKPSFWRKEDFIFPFVGLG